RIGDDALDGGCDGLLPQLPVGLREGLLRRGRFRFGGADFVRPRAGLNGAQVVLHLVDLLAVAVALAARLVGLALAHEPLRHQVELPAPLPLGKRGRNLGLRQLRARRFDLGGTLAFPQVLELRVRLAKALLGLAARGVLVLGLEREQRRAWRDLGAAGRVEGHERSGEGRGHAHVFTLDVALHGWRRLVAAGASRDRRDGQDDCAFHLPPRLWVVRFAGLAAEAFGFAWMSARSARSMRWSSASLVSSVDSIMRAVAGSSWPLSTSAPPARIGIASEPAHSPTACGNGTRTKMPSCWPFAMSPRSTSRWRGRLSRMNSRAHASPVSAS